MTLSNSVALSAPLLLSMALSLLLTTVSWAKPPIQSVTESNPRAGFTPLAPRLANKQAVGQVPGRRRGGARRSTCPEPQVPLTALVPAQKDASQFMPVTYVGGLTVAARPTFWFYTPYALSADMTAEFILQDAGFTIYRVNSMEFAATQATPGFISITLPDAIKPLEIGKTYQWYFKVNCTMESPPFVQGGVQRTALDPDLANQLAAASLSEQAALYQSNGLWFDAIAALGQLYRANPNDPGISSDWISLLASLGLTDMPALANSL